MFKLWTKQRHQTNNSRTCTDCCHNSSTCRPFWTLCNNQLQFELKLEILIIWILKIINHVNKDSLTWTINRTETSWSMWTSMPQHRVLFCLIQHSRHIGESQPPISAYLWHHMLCNNDHNSLIYEIRTRINHFRSKSSEQRHIQPLERNKKNLEP